MSSLPTFRIVSFVEGLSYLLLVLVAMPMKYLMNNPQPVRVLGSAHGFLFVAFVAALAWVHLDKRWPWQRSALMFGLSLVPFGFLFIERSLRSTEARSH
jgi:integral membrane protein